MYQHSTSARAHASKAGNRYRVAAAVNTLGVTQRNTGNYPAAIRHFRQAERILDTLGNLRGRFNALINISAVYQNLHQPDSAIWYAEAALTVARTQDPVNQRQVGYVHVHLHGLEQDRERYKPALRHARAAVENFTPGPAPEYPAALINLAGLYLRMDRFAEAGPPLTKARAVVNAKTDLEYQQKLALHQGTWHAAFGRTDSSRIYFDRYAALTDSIVRKTNLAALAEMEIKYQTQEKEAAVRELSLQKQIGDQQLRSQRWISGLAGAGLLLVSGLAYFLFRQRRRIIRQNRKINRALGEKDILVREIHHRVKNNLQMVSSLLNLQSHYVEDHAARDALALSRGRVRSMAILHQKLYLRDDLTTSIDAAEYLTRLCEELQPASTNGGPTPTIVTDLAPERLDIDTLIPLGLVANELITNALKHAFSGPDPGRLEVSLRRLDDGRLELRVADNGPGITAAALTQGDTFGSLMIRSFTEQLKGTLTIDSTAGTEVKLTI